MFDDPTQFLPPCPDVSKYATKNMIQSCPDMSKYILKSEIPKCEKIDKSKYILKSKIPSYPDQPDLSKYILKSSIPRPCQKCMDDPCEINIPIKKPVSNVCCVSLI